MLRISFLALMDKDQGLDKGEHSQTGESLSREETRDGEPTLTLCTAAMC